MQSIPSDGDGIQKMPQPRGGKRPEDEKGMSARLCSGLSLSSTKCLPYVPCRKVASPAGHVWYGGEFHQAGARVKKALALQASEAHIGKGCYQL